MIMLDFLFNVCYAPFQKEPRGRFIALVWLTPSLTFTFIGALNILLHYLGAGVISIVSPMVGCILAFAIFAAIAFMMDKVYEKGKRDTGKIRFPILHGLLIPILVLGSVIFFAMSLYKFR